MGDDKYRMSFTTGGLFHRESVSVAARYLELGDWKAVRERVMADNLLQCRTVSTLTRVFREVVSRLMTCSREELEYLVRASRRDQGYLLWLAVCRRYGFIARFAVEELRERYITLKNGLGPYLKGASVITVTDPYILCTTSSGILWKGLY